MRPYLDYLALERLSYQSENSDIRDSFATSATLGAIKPPTLQQEDGNWAIDTNHRFFTDDIGYGLCITKWMADQLGLTVPTIDINTRRIIGFATHAGDLDGPTACRAFNQLQTGRSPPRWISTDHDPLFTHHRWKANLRNLGIEEVKTALISKLSLENYSWIPHCNGLFSTPIAC